MAHSCLFRGVRTTIGDAFRLIIPPMGDSSSPNGVDGPTPLLNRRDPYLRLHAVTIFVRDQDESLRFYRDQVGFNLVADVRFQNGDRWVAVAPPDGTAILTLVAPRPDSPEYKLIGRNTRVAFVTEDVLAKFHEWRQCGVRFLSTPRLRRLKRVRQPTDAPPTPGDPEPIWGGVFTRFKDIDGNSFSLVSFDEVVREVEAQRRAAAERLEAERRAAQELDIAKQVQARLFPQTLPPLRTLDYAGLCLQARAVGGDYYDFLNLGGERLGLVVGDISGKGIAAALLMANLQANLRSLCAIAWPEPQHFLRSVNQLFQQNTSDSDYATLFSPNTTTPPGACATRAADTSLRCSFAAIRPWSGSNLPAPCWGCLPSGTARSARCSLTPATPSCFLPTASRNRLTAAERNSASCALSKPCGGIATSLPRLCWRRLLKRSGSSVLTSSTTTSL